MTDTERIYSLLSHSNGLNIRAISKELNLERYYVAEIMFSVQNINYWFQDDDSLWFAKEGALQIDEYIEDNDELTKNAEKPQTFNIDRFLKKSISYSLRTYLSEIPHFRIYSNNEILELIKRYKSGDRRAFELLVKSQQKLVANIALLYNRKYSMAIDDLIQEGNVGLFSAIERFDETQFRSFTNYAKSWVLQAISFSMTRLQYVVKIPINCINLHRKIQIFKEKYVQKNGFQPRADEIKIDDNVSLEQIATIDEFPDNLQNLTILSDNLDVFENKENAFESIEDKEYNKYIANVYLNSLSSRSKRIVKSYYGIGCLQETLEQIGREQNLTRERVRQILFKSIKILRERAKKNDAPRIIENKEPGRNVRLFDDSAFYSHNEASEPNQTEVVAGGQNTNGFFDPVGLLKEVEGTRKSFSNRVLNNPSEGKVERRKSLAVKREDLQIKERADNNSIDINSLSHIFLNTSATYKFYWFISLLQLLQKGRHQKIMVYDIVVRMVANAWIPLIFHNLDYGRIDSLKAIVANIQRYDLIPVNVNVDQIFAILESCKKEYRIKRLLRVLTWNVPYRFLSPWINTSDNKDLMYRSQHWENGCLYSLYMDESEPYILLNPNWMSYLLSHHEELLAFSYQGLSAFLLPKNPKIANIEEIITLYNNTSTPPC